MLACEARRVEEDGRSTFSTPSAVKGAEKSGHAPTVKTRQSYAAAPEAATLPTNSLQPATVSRWAAMALSRFKVGKDNNTAYERQRGKRCRIDTVPFGEQSLVPTTVELRRQEEILPE